MKKVLTTMALLSVIPFVSANITTTATLTSDYIFRGVSQTDSNPAIQLGIDYINENGFSAGVWASNVDFGDDANAEIDFFTRYSLAVNDSLSYDFTYNYYSYAGYKSNANSDYGEAIINAYVNSLTFTYAYAPDYANANNKGHYVAMAYDFELPNDIGLNIQSGYSFGNAFKNAEYIDYGATFSKSYEGFDLSLALISTDIKDNNKADSRAVFAITKAF